MASPEFWNDNEKAQKVQKEKARLQEQVDSIDRLNTATENLEVLLGLIKETPDAELAKECSRELESAENRLRSLELEKMLSGTHDAANAIIEINAGAGGTEAQDWGEMLLRMYSRSVSYTHLTLPTTPYV